MYLLLPRSMIVLRYDNSLIRLPTLSRARRLTIRLCRPLSLLFTLNRRLTNNLRATKRHRPNSVLNSNNRRKILNHVNSLNIRTTIRLRRLIRQELQQIRFNEGLTRNTMRIQRGKYSVVTLGSGVRHASVSSKTRFRGFLPTILLRSSTMRRQIRRFLIMIFTRGNTINALSMRSTMNLRLFRDFPRQITTHTRLLTRFRFNERLITQVRNTISSLKSSPVRSLVSCELCHVLLFFEVFR